MLMPRELTAADILNIGEETLPLMVFSNNKNSFISKAIRWRTGGEYNHFMWMHKPRRVASQNTFFGEQDIRVYLKGQHDLSFWWNPYWDAETRRALVEAIQADLDLPRWQTRYDWLQIVGKLLPWAEWLNVPGTRICSDYASYLSVFDSRYDLYHPAPAEVRRWLQEHEPYGCYGRFKVIK